MYPAPLSPDERNDALNRFLARYLQRGFEVISRSPTTAEVYKPASFPEWLFKEKTRYIDIDEEGLIYVRRR